MPAKSGDHRCLALDFQSLRLIAARITFLYFQCPAPQLLELLQQLGPVLFAASCLLQFPVHSPSLPVIFTSPWYLSLALPHSVFSPSQLSAAP